MLKGALQWSVYPQQTGSIYTKRSMYAGTHFTDPGRTESWVNFKPAHTRGNSWAKSLARSLAQQDFCLARSWDKYLACLIIFASPKRTRTREETAELTASGDFLLSCFLSCAPGFSGKEGRPNIQPSTRTGIEPGTSGLAGRDLYHCTNPSAGLRDSLPLNKKF